MRSRNPRSWCASKDRCVVWQTALWSPDPLPCQAGVKWTLVGSACSVCPQWLTITCTGLSTSCCPHEPLVACQLVCMFLVLILPHRRLVPAGLILQNACSSLHVWEGGWLSAAFVPDNHRFISIHSFAYISFFHYFFCVLVCKKMYSRVVKPNYMFSLNFTAICFILHILQ